MALVADTALNHHSLTRYKPLKFEYMCDPGMTLV